MRPGGSTAISPALEAAFRLFRAPGRPAGARRHLVLISDGTTSDDDANRALGLARAGGVQISAVAVGSNPNRTLLDALARATGGRAYFPDRLGDLPRVVAREAARLMSFPDEHVFPERQSMASVARQVGNAVPPLLALRLADAIAQALDGFATDADAGAADVAA